MEVDGLPQLTLDILSELRDMQQTHGLRSADFGRYRQFCQRKIRRICKAQKFLHGSGKKYVPRPVVAGEVQNNALILLVLLQAERAWAYAEDLKEMNSEGDVRKHHHRVARLNRAAKWSRDLHELTVARCDENTQLQAEGYHYEKVGLVELAKLNYEPALEAYTKAKDVWTKLASVSSLKELILQRVGDLEQNRRLCGYKLGLDTSKFETMEGISAGGADSTCSADLHWRGKPVALYSDALRDLAAEAQEKSAAIAAERAKPQDFTSGTTALNNTLELYNKLFISYNDAIAIVKQDLRQESADSAQLHLILNFFSYILLDYTIQRNLYLVEAYTARYLAGGKEKTAKKVTCPSDIVRLYDILVQNGNEMLAIPGIEDDDELGGKYEGQLLLNRATRMYWKAEAFSRATQYAEAIACLIEAEKFISDAYAFNRKRSLDTADCEAMSGKIRARKCIAQGSSFLLHHKKGEQLADEAAEISLQEERPGRKLVDHLYDYTECDELIGVPLDWQSIPCKPLFYDVAANYIQEVDTYERSGKKRRTEGDEPPKKEKVKAEKKEEPVQEEKKATGWLSSFW